jgi:hypothetical protein
MTAQEFTEWSVWCRLEEEGPAADRLRHGQLVAATMNGAVTRKVGGMFRASELIALEPWAPPPPPPAPLTNAQIAAQVEAMNARFGD